MEEVWNWYSDDDMIRYAVAILLWVYKEKATMTKNITIFPYREAVKSILLAKPVKVGSAP